MSERDTVIATVITLGAIVVPLGIAFGVSLVRSPIYVVGRHDMIAWGAYYLLAGAVLARLDRRLGLGAAAAWVLLSVLTLVPYFTTTRPKTNYADMGDRIAAALSAAVRPGETVVFTAATRTMTQYYLRAQPDRFRLLSYPLGGDDHLGWIDPRIRTDAAFAAEQGGRFAAWLVDAGTAPAVVWIVAPATRGTPPLLTELERRGYHSDQARSTGLLLCLRRSASPES